jgi:hypothetical protein
MELEFFFFLKKIIAIFDGYNSDYMNANNNDVSDYVYSWYAKNIGHRLGNHFYKWFTIDQYLKLLKILTTIGNIY